MNMSELASKVRELSREYHKYVCEYSHGTATGWHILILDSLEHLNNNIEAVQERLDEITLTLENINFATHGQIEKSNLILKVEAKFGKSIEELLSERKGKGVREIADEFGISKSTISNWLKLLK